MRLKKGDIVKIANPLPDENPDTRYIVVQECIEEFEENDQIDCMLIGSKFCFPPISRIEMCDLEIIK